MEFKELFWISFEKEFCHLEIIYFYCQGFTLLKRTVLYFPLNQNKNTVTNKEHENLSPRHEKQRWEMTWNLVYSRMVQLFSQIASIELNVNKIIITKSKNINYSDPPLIFRSSLSSWWGKHGWQTYFYL